MLVAHPSRRCKAERRLHTLDSYWLDCTTWFVVRKWKPLAVPAFHDEKPAWASALSGTLDGALPVVYESLGDHLGSFDDHFADLRNGLHSTRR